MMMTELEAARAELHRIEPEAHCTYSPMEGKYQVSVWGSRIGDFEDTKITALRKAIHILKGEQCGSGGHG